jgi:predicted esterase
LALHATGGDERDLVSLARTINPHGAILSPRRAVVENGKPRFVRRVVESAVAEGRRADVTLNWVNAGHSLVFPDIQVAAEWFGRR